MAGGSYSATIQELKKSQDCLASSMSDLNFLKRSVEDSYWKIKLA
ncbi:hypothetical protein GQ600_8631 [Phytophthora cactorum]|nr:hypothetical protein GQ600_8631 [Phytophthora cactorum]